MNNAQTLDNHNVILEENNADLSSILNTVTALPTRPKGRIDITANGEYDVKEYASANVDVAQDTTMEDSLVMKNITHYSNDRVTTVGVNGFYGWSTLKSVSFPNVTYLNGSAFQSCTGLENVYFPKLETIGSYSFRSCSSLKELVLPSVKTINGLRSCTSLEKLDISSAEDESTTVHSFSASTFYSTDTLALNTIIIRYTKGIFTLGANLPANCPIRQGTGYIYVPKSLVENYKSATNWSTCADQIRAIEYYPEICGGEN